MGDAGSDAGKGWEICEIIPSQMAMTIPGPFVGLHTWYLWFNATRDGRTDQPPIHQKEAGQIPESEMRRLAAQGSVGFEENSTRICAVEKLTEALQADGWEYIETGEHWFSRRFRKTR